MQYHFRNRKGSLIIESIVGISIAVVGLLGVLGLLSRSLAINKDVGQKFVATYLAAEGIEVVKSLIDKNYADGNAWNNGISEDIRNHEVSYDSTGLITPATGNPLLFDADDGTYSYTNGDPTLFTRTIDIEEVSVSEIQVNSIVSWSSRGSTQEINLEDHFFDWRP